MVWSALAVAQTRPVNTTANPIDLNSASRDALMALDGIGEVKADAIIRSRPFKAKTELVERRIIPEALYEKIADKVFARPPPPTPPAKPAGPTKRG
ncbi:MAG TPA: helix-hairpin-helix domain-containing protein [Reyranella sp.]|nr:helix-hairpin-helix domain-containing protein [Reyranella sp.]